MIIFDGRQLDEANENPPPPVKITLFDEAGWLEAVAAPRIAKR